MPGCNAGKITYLEETLQEHWSQSQYQEQYITETCELQMGNICKYPENQAIALSYSAADYACTVW